MKLTKRTISNIATYFMGTAIGIVLVGAIMSMKQKVFQQHQAKQAHEAQQRSQQVQPTDQQMSASDESKPNEQP